MRAQYKSLALTSASLFIALTLAQGQTTDLGSIFQLGSSPSLNLTTLGYDNLGTAATAGYSEAMSGNPTFGDSLTLALSGKLTTFGCGLYNSSSGGNTGSFLTGSMLVNFYNNTAPYAGGPITGALLGTATLSWDFTSEGGLPPGYYETGVFDLSSLNINLTQNVLVTQQYTQLTGNSTRNGLILFSDPVVGSSPNTVYLKSATTAEGLYTFTGNPGQLGFTIGIEAVPEPTSVCLLGLGIGAWMVSRRRTA